jgi:DNA-damage-inducible protein J
MTIGFSPERAARKMRAALSGLVNSSIPIHRASPCAKSGCPFRAETTVFSEFGRRTIKTTQYALAFTFHLQYTLCFFQHRSINMTKTTVLQVRLDEQTKKKADTLFSEIGLNTTSAVRFFITQSILRNGLAFDAVGKKQNDPFYKKDDDPFYNEENQKAIRSAIADLEAGKGEFHELIEFEE